MSTAPSSGPRLEAGRTHQKGISGKNNSFNKIMDRILDKPAGKAAQPGVPVESRAQTADTRKSNNRGSYREKDNSKKDNRARDTEDPAAMEATSEIVVSETIIESVMATETASTAAIEQFPGEPVEPASTWNVAPVADEQAGAEENLAISNPEQSLSGASENIPRGDKPTEDEIIMSSELRKVLEDAPSRLFRQEPRAEQLPEPRLENSALPQPADEATGKSNPDSTALQAGALERAPDSNIPLPGNIESLRGKASATQNQDQANVNSEATGGELKDKNPAPGVETGNIPKPVLSFEDATQGNLSRATSEVAPTAPRIIEVEPLRAGSADKVPGSEPTFPSLAQAEQANAGDSKNANSGMRDDKESSFERFASGIEESRFAARTEFHPAMTLEKSPEGELAPAAKMDSTDVPQANFDQMLTRTERLHEVIERIDEHVLELTSGKGTSMTISLVPPNLGKLILNCKESSEGISIQIVASSSEARQFLADREGMIREILANRGRDLAEFDVKTEDNNPGQRQFAQQRAKEEDEPTGRLADISEPARTEERVDTIRESERSGEGFWYVA